MEHIVYPLIYFELDKEEVLGLLVGTEYKVVEKDVRNVRSTLTSYLQRQYKKYGDYQYSAVEEPKLKIFKIKVRPTYKAEGRSYPATQELEVPVPVVYGESSSGYFECYLPLQGESFYYYEAKALEPLVKNFANNYFSSRAPEDIYRLMLLPRPQLDTVTLKINPQAEYKFNNGWDPTQRFAMLNSMAEQYPQNKALRRQLSAFPEAAWELEDKVSEIVSKIIDTRSNVLIVGNHGVGKSSALRQAIRKIVQPNKREGYTFWQLMSQRLLAQAKYLGEWQENVEDLIDDLQAANGILWVMDIMQLMQIGGEGPEDSVAAFMTNFMQNNQLQMVGEVTQSELESMRRYLPGFAENFQIVQIPELPEKSIHTILDKFSEYCAQNLKIEIDRPAIEMSYRLLLRYFPYESFPGKAIKFLSQAVDDARIGERDKINKKNVIDLFIKKSGMPEMFLRDDMLLDSNELQSFFTKQIIGQDNAIHTLSGVVKIFKAGLNNPLKPISTMIFAGPTGVGKTASAKALADYFFGKGQKRSPLIRIDMSEFQNPYQLARFIGAGGEVGKLVQEVRERPFSVLLLDEIEKADPSIFDSLLTVLDEGVLVDAFGRVTNFRNTIIIMTSNLGASGRASIGFGGGASTNYESAIGQFFRPEFVNRIDHIVTFKALDAQNIRDITQKELDDLANREGFTKRRLKLNFTEAIKNHLAAVGFDERYGARPLQRAIENEVVGPLAKWLLKNNSAQDKTLYIDFDGKQAVVSNGN